MPRKKEVLENMVAKAKAEILHDRDKSLKWERNTNLNAKDLLKIFSDELKATTEELFP